MQKALADPDTVIEIGRMLGVEAVWTGTTSKTMNSSNYTETTTECSSTDSKGNCTGHTKSTIICTTLDVSLKFFPELISVSTSEVIYSKSFENNQSSEFCSDSYNKASLQSLLKDATDDVFENLRKDIAPYPVMVELGLMNDAGDIADKESKKLLKRGLEFAENDQLKKACTIWFRAIEGNHDSVTLNYNIAVCLEVAGLYEDAYSILLDIEKNLAKPNKLITASIKRNKTNIKNKERLNWQLSQ